jgi:hypothetical protein
VGGRSPDKPPTANRQPTSLDGVLRVRYAENLLAQFKGTLTPDLYKRGLRFHGTAAPWFAVLLILTGISGMAMGISAGSDAGLSISAGVATLGVFLLIYPSLLVRRVFKTNALLRDGFAGTANESTFVAESPNGVSNIAWEKFHQAVMAPDMVLLYVSAHQFFILPREFFASERDWTEFQALVRQRVRLRSRGRVILRLALAWLALVGCVFFLWSVVGAPAP